MTDQGLPAAKTASARSLQWALTGLIGVIVLVISVAMSAVALTAIVQNLTDRIDQQLRISMDMATRQKEAGPGSPEPDSPSFARGPDRIEPEASPRLGTIKVVASEGNTLSAQAVTDLGMVIDLGPGQLEEIAKVVSAGKREVAVPDLGSYRILSQTVGPPSDRLEIVVGQNLSEVRHTTRNVAIVLLAATLGATLLASLAGSYLVRRALKPLQNLRETAAEIQELPLGSGVVSLSGRVKSQEFLAGTEVGDLAGSFTQMLGHIEAALNQREATERRLKQFAADASHELRTPLAAISGHAELASRSRELLPENAALSLERIRSETGRMATLVEDLLLLARLDSNDAGPTEHVDVARLVTDCVTDAQVMGQQHKWILEMVDADRELLVAGNAVRIHQAVANLLANARQHTPPGTTVTTKVSTDGSSVRICVTDDGPGIAPELLARVFDRFSRGDTARSQPMRETQGPGVSGQQPSVGSGQQPSEGSGSQPCAIRGRDQGRSTGLGLAITDLIVRSAGGTVTVESEPGHTEFVISIPLVN